MNVDLATILKANSQNTKKMTKKFKKLKQFFGNNLRAAPDSGSGLAPNRRAYEPLQTLKEAQYNGQSFGFEMGLCFKFF